METKLKSLEPPDDFHLKAAEGWLELGNWLEANDEVERITPTNRAHPNVLKLRWEIYGKAEKWEMAAEVGRGVSITWPENAWGFIRYAYALHRLKRTKEAWGVLIPVVDKFPDEPRISYNLACYCCQLGELKDSLRWIETAIAIAGKKDIRLMALEDDDLKPLWTRIGEI